MTREPLILMDAWLLGNPLMPITMKNVALVDKVYMSRVFKDKSGGVYER